jgi:iron-sulfur cluster assembly protein
MITIDAKAGWWLKKQLNARGHGAGIRLGTKTSGCSGYKYVLEFVNSPEEADIVFEAHDVKFYVDPKSMLMLDGMAVVYKVEGINEGIEFENPNATGSCGCGESFAV